MPYLVYLFNGVGCVFYSAVGWTEYSKPNIKQHVGYNHDYTLPKRRDNEDTLVVTSLTAKTIPMLIFNIIRRGAQLNH